MIELKLDNWNLTFKRDNKLINLYLVQLEIFQTLIRLFKKDRFNNKNALSIIKTVNSWLIKTKLVFRNELDRYFDIYFA